MADERELSRAKVQHKTELNLYVRSRDEMQIFIKLWISALALGLKTLDHWLLAIFCSASIIN